MHTLVQRVLLYFYSIYLSKDNALTVYYFYHFGFPIKLLDSFLYEFNRSRNFSSQHYPYALQNIEETMISK